MEALNLQPHQVIIRQADRADAVALAALYRTLVTDPDIDVRPERLEALAEDPHTYLLVCEVDGLMCGTVHFTLCLDALYGNQPFGVIDNVVVAEALRCQGIGERLMAHAEELACRHDCSKLMLLSAASRTPAHRLFERRGFSAANKRGFVKYRSQFQLEAPKMPGP